MLASSWLFTVSPSSTPCSAYITSIYLKSITLRKLMMITIVVVMLCLGLKLIQHCSRIALQRIGCRQWNAFRCVAAACVNKSRLTAIGQRLPCSHASSGKHYVIASFTNQVTKPSLTGRAQHHIAVHPIEYDSSYRP